MTARVARTVALGAGVLLLALIATFSVLRLTGLWERMVPPMPRRTIDFATLEPGGKPNRYLVCPPGLCERAVPDAAAPIYPVPAGRLREAFLSLLEREPSVVVESDDGEVLELVQRTPLMRWPDRITIRLLPLGPAESTLAVYSRSTYGRSDLGANRRRITGWLDRLPASLP